MTASPLIFRPGGLIPPAAGVKMVMRPKTVAAQPAAAIPVVASGCESDPFFLAKFGGDVGRDLTDYKPDCGLPFTAPDVNFDDGTWTNVGANPGLASCKLQGDGTFLFSTALGRILVLKPGTQPAHPDYFMEAEFALDPATVALNVLLAARCGAITPPDDFLPFVGVEFDAELPGYGAALLKGDGAGGTSTSAMATDEVLASGVQTVLLRADFVGGKVMARVNSTLLEIKSFADPLYTAAGEIYFAFNFADDGIGGTLFAAPVMTLRAGYL